MADKRTIKFEIGVDADTKGVERFGRVLNDLQKAAPIADSELRKVRQAVLEFSQQSGTSANSLKALESALAKLQNEAAAGGSTWKLLGKDIAGVRQQLGELTGTIRSAEQVQKEFNRALNAPVGETFNKIAAQVATLKRELGDLKFRSEDYLRTLTRIREVETVGSFYQGRLNTIAANQAFMGATLSRGYGASERLPGLPDTIAGDSQRVSELTERIRNLDRGSELYLQTVKELAGANAQAARAQEQLNKALNDSPIAVARQRLETQRSDTAAILQDAANYRENRAIRRSIERNQEKRAREAERNRIAAAEAFPPSQILALPAAGETTFRGSIDSRGFGGGARSRITGGESPLIIATDRPGRQAFRGENSYAGPDLGINVSAINASTQAVKQQRGALSELFLTVDSVTKSSNGSISSLQRQREAWQNLRSAVNPLAPAYAKAGAAIDEIDKKLANAPQTPGQIAAQQQERYRNRLRQAGQSATAVGVAGYFGGPEAVVGAGVGSVFGPGGAQIGTTAGLAVGGIRAQVGRFSDQAAQLNKLQQSLRSIAGSESEYTRAIGAINAANRELNIPLLEGTRAMTQLTAAVKGAGGTVADAELAYSGITSAIKATGGSSADAEGAIRALVQTFSKGKVSAEEIRQQLAERLPGAVTLFAQATGRTGAELDKAFEQGKVGLNDLMKFLATLDSRYSETARRLAASNDEAGLRLQLRWEATTLAIGKAFQPLGAEIQNSFIKIIEDNEDAVIQFAKSVATLTKTLGENKSALEGLKVVGEVAKIVAIAGGIKLATSGLKALVGALVPAGTQITTSGGAALAAAGKLDKLKTAAIALSKAWKPALTLAVSIVGYQKALDVLKRLSNYQNPDAKGFVAGLGGLAQDPKILLREREKLQKEPIRRRGPAPLKSSDLAGVDPLAGAFVGIVNSLIGEVDSKRPSVAQGRIKEIDAVLAKQKELKKAATGARNSKLWQEQQQQQDKDADAQAKRQAAIAQQLAAERQRLLEDNTQQEIRLADEVHRHKVELDQRRFDRQKELADLQARAEMARMSPNQRGIAELMRGISQSTSDYDRLIREAEQRFEQANRQVANAQRMATVTGAGLGGGRAIPAFGGARTNRVRDRDAEATGWDIVMPGGRGAAVRAPLALTITGTGFQGSGAGPKGKGYGNWISGEFQLNGKTYELVLGHFDKIHVAKGMQVPVGGQLGTQGITGRTFGAHATAHVNPKNGASVNDAWRALDAITRIWEGRTTPGAVQRTPPGVAAQRRRNVADGGDIAVALAGQQAAQTELNDLKENRAKFIDASANAQIAEYVRNTRDSTAALKEETQQLRDRNRLTLEGFRPEIVDGMVQQLAEQRKFQDERRQLDADIQSGDTDRARKATDTLNELTAAYESNIRAIQDRTQAQLDARAADENAFDFRRGARQYVESIGSMRDATASLTQTGIRGVEDALMSLATTGTANFQAFAVSILQETSRMIIQQLVLKTIMQALGFLGGSGLGGGGGFSFGGSSGGFTLGGFEMPSYMSGGNAFGFARGGLFTEQGVQLFAKGGVVAKPTFFRYANGGSFANGVMGEAGPEAILPLKRGSDGKLGVSTGGGGSPVAVTVNVDASGTKAQGSSDQGQQLGRAVAAAVQAELVKQKRPGGLLAS